MPTRQSCQPSRPCSRSRTTNWRPIRGGEGGSEQKSASKPAAKAAKASDEDEDVVKRMQKLTQLKQLGLISEEEYEMKRKEMLSKL